MFDIGFSELVLFGVIALIVLGPEKLPQAARTAGQWYAKIRRTVSTLQSEIEAELDLAETRQQMQKELVKIRQTEAEMRREMAEMRGNMRAFEDSQHQNLRANSQHSDTDQQEVSSSPPTHPEYAYAANKDISLSPPSSNTDAHKDAHKLASQQPVSTILTRPWENMWFRLGDYDKARRLPAAPYLPNYKADVLLHTQMPNQVSIDKPETE